MNIIDFEKRGNVVRFYLGEKTEEWGWVNPNYKDYNGDTPDWLKPKDRYYGDDWNDVPYECNAGSVYGEFIKGYKDISFPFDYIVLEPCDTDKTLWCKDDMADRRVPCIVVIKFGKPNSADELIGGEYICEDFNYWACGDRENVIKYYFGDNMDPDVSFIQ